MLQLLVQVLKQLLLRLRCDSFAKHGGKVIFVDSNRIVIQRDKFKDDESGVDIYKLVKYQRTNQNTCNNQKALVKEGDTC
jgi:DNA-directed RNA polymerase subunit beta